MPTYSINGDNLDELMGTLNRGEGNSWSDDPRTAATLRISFPEEIADLPESVQDAYSEPSAEGLDPFEAFNIFQRANAIQALYRWDDVANLTFQILGPGDEADIYLFGRGFEDGGGYSTGVDPEIGSLIRINTEGEQWTTMEPGGRGFRTLIHEIGHSLGLSHPGEYDVGDNATYETHADYIEDTSMYSIMSYFGGSNTGFDANGLGAELLTPRAHDIWVIQELYGANWSTRSGDTTYGYNISGVAPDGMFDFAAWPNDFGPILTIWDGGGIDWLDLSGDSNDLLLDLNPGAFSSTHGMTFNLSIAFAPGEAAPAGSNSVIENARGGQGDDELIGNTVDNQLEGGGGRDTLSGGTGDDTLKGGSGSDVLIGGLGEDSFDGGSGWDTVDYSYSSDGWSIDLGDGVNGSAGNAFGTEVLLNIENIVGSQGDDDISGSYLENDLSGGEGDDTIEGLDADDTLYGGLGHDELRGGDGDDTILGYAVLWTAPTDYDNDTIFGGDGNDWISASHGGDLIFGGADNDTVIAGGGDDTVSGGFGVDDLDGGLGTDEVTYTYSSSNWQVDLLVGSAFTSGSETESVVAFERVRMGSGKDTVFGSHDDNIIWGGSGADSLNGAGGSDILFGEAGGDTLDGGDGNDVLNGGDGTDTAKYGTALAGVVVDLAYNGLAQNTIGAGIDTLIDVERLEGSTHADILYGDAGANWVFGGGGNDLLFGREGDDWLRGGSGNDTLEGGIGNDILMGDEGSDTASYYFAAAGVVVSLAIAGEQNTLGAGTDVFYGIENIIGSFYADWLTGNGAANRLNGGAGNDVFSGGGGADELIGGEGDDVLNGGSGGDILDGGNGNDWAYYNSQATSGVRVDLAKSQQATGLGTDTITNVENLLGSSYGDDLRGNAEANEIHGGGGNDTIFGGGGNDTIRGGDGNDSLYVGTISPAPPPGGLIRASLSGSPETILGVAFGSGSDLIVFTGGWGRDEIYGFTPGSDVLDFTLIAGLEFGDLAISDTDGGAFLAYGANSVLLRDVAEAALSETDFLFG